MTPLAIGGPQAGLYLTITLVAVFFGTVWVVSNFYSYYPMVQYAVDRAVSRVHHRLRGGPVGERRIVPRHAPEIDVLLPAYEEAAVIQGAVESILSAEYPADRLTLTVLLEPGDDATRSAVEALAPEYDFQVLTVPADYPGDPNKPRALDYGFEHTSGDVVGVIDAEDVVDPDLFREVAVAITEGADYAQGRLDMVNEGDGWVNLLFRAEYGYWYRLVVAAFRHVGYPVPLSGTTAFVRRTVLTALAEDRYGTIEDPWSEADWTWVEERWLSGRRPWDPRNVTEDFEMGLRLWLGDYELAYLDAVTAEESPPTLGDWIRQRTRWKKGKLFTFMDFLRDPPASGRDRLHVFWQSLLPHLGPVNVAGVVLIAMVANLAYYRPTAVVVGVLSLGLAFAVVTALLHGLGYYLVTEAPALTRLRRTVVVVLTLPAYWVLQWGADIRALVQLYGEQLDWEPTTHEGRRDADISPADPAAVGRRPDRFTLPWPTRVAAVSLLVVLAFGLRWYRLGARSLWTDELYSVAIRGDLPVGQLLAVPSDPHPPLYYLLLHYWMDWFGTTPTGVRSLSVALSLVGVVAVYLLGTELFDDRTGLTAALLFSISPFQVHFGRMARMYALFVALTALSWYWFARLRDGKPASALGYVLFTGALLYTHVYALFVLAAQHVYVALSEVDGGIRPRRWAGLQAALGLVAFPWLVFLAGRALRILYGIGGPTVEWIPRPSVPLVTRTLVVYAGFPDLYPVKAGGLAVYVLACAVLFVYGTQLLASLPRFVEDGIVIEDVGRIGQLAALLVVPVLVPFLVSFVVPIYVPRYSIPASIAFLLLAARGLRNVPAEWVRFGLVTALCLSSLLLLGVYYGGGTVEPWDRTADYVAEGTGPDDVVVQQGGRVYVQYYHDGPARAVTLRQSESVTAGDLAFLRQLSAARDTVYLIRTHETGGPAVDLLEACHRRVRHRSFGTIHVYRAAGDLACRSRPVGPPASDTEISER